MSHEFRRLEVGDTVWFLGRHSDSGRPLTVSKVGRKWVTFNHSSWRAEIGSSYVEEPGYGFVGRIYESEDAYRRERDAWILKGRLETSIGKTLQHLTLDQLQALADQLKEWGHG